MASVGSSHSALISGEDHEEASLLGCPPIGLLHEEEFGTMPSRNQARDRALYPRPKTPRLYGPLGSSVDFENYLRDSGSEVFFGDFWFRYAINF